jgi:hypothetical protein
VLMYNLLLVQGGDGKDCFVALRRLTEAIYTSGPETVGLNDVVLHYARKTCNDIAEDDNRCKD